MSNSDLNQNAWEEAAKHRNLLSQQHSLSHSHEAILTAVLRQIMNDSLKSNVLEKINALSMSLHSEIASVRQELYYSVESLKCKVNAHELAR